MPGLQVLTRAIPVCSIHAEAGAWHSASTSRIWVSAFAWSTLARCRYSPTVLWEMEQLRAIARFVSHFRRRTLYFAHG